MDRQIVYPGAIPLETDLLHTNKYAMIGLSKIAEAILGTGTLLSGLPCTPTAPASMQVQIGAGQVYALANLDATAFSSLAADTTHSILKQGLLMDAVNLSCPAPATTGYSINYLVQVAYSEVDSGAVVLPYYNASNPAQAYSGPNNSGSAQNTVRGGVCNVAVKAGVAATTGTQTTPAPDAGFVGAYVVTVANGQTTINSGDISAYGSAPFIPATLTNLAPLASPAFTGSPTGPTPTSGDSSTKLATTAFVMAALHGVLSKSVAGGANVTLSASEAGNGILVFTGALTANINVIVPVTGEWIVRNSTTGSYTLTVKTSAGTGVAVTQGANMPLYADGTNVVVAISDVPTPAQFDNTTKVATTGFVRSAKGGTAGVNAFNVSTTLTLADVGKQILFYGSTAGQTITLPAAETVPAGEGYWITNQASVAVTLKGNGSQNLSVNLAGAGQSLSNTTVLKSGDSLFVPSNGANQWNIHGYTSDGQFPSSLAANGYLKLPSGLIIQWGQVAATAATGTTTFPIAFPNNVFIQCATDYETVGTAVKSLAVLPTLTDFQWAAAQGATATDPGTFAWFAVGN